GSAIYATDANPALFNVNAGGISTDGFIGEIAANVATTIDGVLRVSGNALTSGNGLVVAGTGVGLTGNLFSATSASTSAATNGLARFNFSGTHTGNGLQIDDATLTGAAQQITASGVLTGVGSALSITADSATTAGAVAGEGVVRLSADGLTTGTALDVTSTAGNALTTGRLADFSHISGNITGTLNKTADLFNVSSARTVTTGTVADDYDMVNFTRTSDGVGAGSFTATGSVLRVENSSLVTEVTDSTHLIELVQDSDSSGDALNIDMNAALGAAALTVIDASGLRTDAIVDITTSSTGATDAASIFQITSSGVLGATANIIDVNVSGVASAPNVLDITYATDAVVGNAIDLNMVTNVAGDAINIASAATTGNGVIITNTNARSSGSSLGITDSATVTASASTAFITASTITDVDALTITTATQTTGNAMTINAGASIYSTGSALEVTGSAIYATDANPALFNVNAGGISTDGFIGEIAANVATTIDGVLRVSGNALTSGNGLVVAGTGTALTGNLFSATSASTGVATNGLARFNFSGTHTGNGLQIDDATLTGAAQQITASGILTGVGSALSITADAATTAGAVAGEGIVRLSADGLTTGTALDVTSTSINLAAGELANFEHITSGTIVAKTGQLIDITSSRDNTAVAVVADDYDAFSITRTSINTTAGGTLTATGSALYIENVATQTAGTLTDSANLVQLVQDSDSSGDAINIDMNAALGAAALTVIDASGLRTDAIVDITTSSTGATDAASIFQITSSGVLGATANIIDVNVSGIASAPNVLDITYASDAVVGNAIDLNMGTNVAGDAINIASAATTGNGVIITNTNARSSGSSLGITDSATVTASASTAFITASTITDVDALTITTATQTTG
ncbi:MAG: hypothetical protein WC560_13075, partial [Syntrophales bacterium]